MSTVDQPNPIKKRLMFLTGEDFNFLAYNMLVLLLDLGCTTKDSQFKDHRKLAYLIDFISAPRLTRIIQRRKRLNSPLGERDKHELTRAYANGASRVHLITRLICAMERRGILAVAKQTQSPALDIHLNKKELPRTFVKTDLYTVERDNIKELRSYSSHVRSLKLNSLLEQLFEVNGVRIWRT